MITKEKVQFLLEEVLSDDMFIVDITVGTANQILVSVDSYAGISVGECVQISRHIENSLDREIEDFSLEVSSPGLSAPFKVLRQYLKNIGGEVEVVTLSGEKKKGTLKSADSAGFELEIVSKEKVDGKKVEVTKSLTYSFDQIKTVKIIISFN
ncbi:MAG: ribosome assembly cofactor RimP [Bacteroidia bacterium]|nr:ribosome assembly cofactor RimP [Bacteroidia bacterium]